MRVFLALLILSSCNPVKQVLKKPAYFNVIKDSVLKGGYCVNDTSFVYVTDTLEIVDTLVEIYTDTLQLNDTTIFWDVKYRTITNTRIIRDSIKSVVIDSSMVGVLRKELWLEKEKSKENKSWKKMFFIAIGGAIAFFLLLFKLK